MFVGKYYNSIDSKSRVIVPAKFRLELGGRCIVAKALDKCLTVYPFEQWEKFVNEKLELLPDFFVLPELLPVVFSVLL